MASYRGDPYWLTARYAGTCAGCHGPIRRSERVFYYPQGKHTFCAADPCGGAASRDFESHRADEDGY